MKFNTYFTVALLLVCGNALSQVSDKYTELGYFAIAKQVTILPVQVTSFEATKNEKAVILSWETHSETNTNYFSIEKLVNGLDFKQLATVQAAGYSTTAKAYQTWDNQPEPGTNYYRLTQYDKDGKATVFPVKKVQMPLNKIAVKIYPNPLSGTVFYVEMSVGNFNRSIRITDAQGKNIYSFSSADNRRTQAIQLNHPLPAGLYLVTVTVNGTSQTTKLVVK